jgi:hypothetical protein
MVFEVETRKEEAGGAAARSGGRG